MLLTKHIVLCVLYRTLLGHINLIICFSSLPAPIFTGLPVWILLLLRMPSDDPLPNISKKNLLQLQLACLPYNAPIFWKSVNENKLLSLCGLRCISLVSHQWWLIMMQGSGLEASSCLERRPQEIHSWFTFWPLFWTSRLPRNTCYVRSAYRVLLFLHVIKRVFC